MPSRDRSIKNPVSFVELSFHHQPKTIEDIIDQTIGKAFDYFELEHDLYRRWGGGSSS